MHDAHPVHLHVLSSRLLRYSVVRLPHLGPSSSAAHCGQRTSTPEYEPCICTRLTNGLFMSIVLISFAELTTDRVSVTGSAIGHVRPSVSVDLEFLHLYES